MPGNPDELSTLPADNDARTVTCDYPGCTARGRLPDHYKPDGSTWVAQGGWVMVEVHRGTSWNETDQLDYCPTHAQLLQAFREGRVREWAAPNSPAAVNAALQDALLDDD